MTDSTGLALFFLFMTVAEGGGRRAITRKFQEVYIPSLKANYMVWPAVQMLNFRIVPLQFQIVSFLTDSVLRLTGSAATRVYGRYRVDRVPQLDEFFRRVLNLMAAKTRAGWQDLYRLGRCKLSTCGRMWF